MLNNKKGQDVSVTTIILIILGVVVLVVLILGFTKGWNNIAGWFSGGDAQQMSSQCSVACAAQNIYDWCDQKRGKDQKTCAGYVTDKKVDACNAIPTCPDTTSASGNPNPAGEQ